MLFVTAFVVGLSGAMVPGPLTVVLTRHALRGGLRAGPLITLGHGLLEALIVVLLLFGLDSLLARDQVVGIIGLTGGLVLIWMGSGIFRSPGTPPSLEEEKENEDQGPGSFLAGMVATISNPYWFLWWATVGATYVALSREQGVQGVLLFFSGHLLADFAWLMLLALALVTGRRFFTDRIYRGVMKFLGLMLVILAGYFIWSGLQFLGFVQL